LADFEAKIVVVEKKHDAELVVAAAKYEEKCKESYSLEAEMEETNKEVEVLADDNVDDENDDDDNDVDAKKCKVVA